MNGDTKTMSACQVYGQAIKRHRLYALACCFALSLAAAPSHAAFKAGHRGGSKAPRPAVHAHEGTAPNVLTNDVGTYRISYVRSHRKSAASIVIYMHLANWDEISDGSGSFQKQTPQGEVLVKWHHEQVTLDASHPDGYGRSIGSEFSTTTAYTLTIDSPKALPVQLKTQQYSLWAVYLNGSLISKEAYSSGLSGEIDGLPPFSDRHHDQRFKYSFPGGHNVIILQALGWRQE